MNKENKDLLTEVTAHRLKGAMNSEIGSEEAKTSFKEAMEAVDRQLKLSELEASVNERLRKEEADKKEASKNLIIKCLEIGCVTVVGPVIGYKLNRNYAELICNFEKDYSFTTLAGKGLSSLFRFKK